MATVSDLAARFSGRLLQPTDAGYDDARRVHNGLIDKRPSLDRPRRNSRRHRRRRQARARQRTRSGRQRRRPQRRRPGHDRRRPADRPVAHERHSRRRQEPNGAGARRRDLGGVQSRNPAPWSCQHRRRRLVDRHRRADARRRARMAHAGNMGWRSTTCAASSSSRPMAGCSPPARTRMPDLFWALRGGGGNFGIAIGFEFDVHPGGADHHRRPRRASVSVGARRPALLPRDHGVDRRRADALSAVSFTPPTVRAPSWTRWSACHCGTAADGEPAHRPLKAFGTPAMDVIGPMPYAAVNQMLDAAFPKGALNYWRQASSPRSSDAAIDTMIDCYSRVPVADVGHSPRAFSRRGHTRPGWRDGVSAPDRGLQFRDPRGVAGPRRRRSATSTGRGRPTPP